MLGPAQALIASSGLIAALIAVGQILRPSTRRRGVFAGMLGIVAVLQLAGALLPEASQWSDARGWSVILVHTGAKLALGPLLFLFFQELAGTRGPWRATHMLHWMPALAFAPAVVFLVGFPPPVDAPGNPAETTAQDWFRILATASTLWVTAYIAAGAAQFDLASLRAAPSRQKLLGLVTAVVCLFPAGASVVWFWLSPEVGPLRQAHLAGSALIGVYVILSERNPDFLTAVTAASRPYGRSRTSGIDVAAVKGRLQTLMQGERIYREEDLTLPRLAARVDLTVHQLSGFLNDHLGVNFPTYVNNHRVAEARDLLQKHPNRTSLSIGMEVGFNSYTAFHTAFRRLEGVPPGKFRRRALDL